MTSRIAIVGEAYGEDEARAGLPFVGKAGQQFNELLAEAGIDRTDCLVTNTFNLRPDRNDITTLFRKKSDGPIVSEWPALSNGLYLQPEYKNEIDRLLGELATYKPNVVVLLGNTACWAVLKRTSISKIRGTLCTSPLLEGKFLPTYHPANILRQWENRPVTVLDLQKARRESEFPELRRPIREIWMEPTLEDLEEFFERFVRSAEYLAFDVETAKLQITCIGFSPSPERCIVIPFQDPRQTSQSYWPTLGDEVQAWEWVRRYLGSSSRKIAQNGMYDIQYLWRAHGIPVANFAEDTMLLHHSLFPEAPKSLGYLGSVYTNEVAWKNDRPRGKEVKREDEE